MITGHVFIATSLDGFIARSDGRLDWLLSRDSPDEDHGYDEFLSRMDVIVMGRGGFQAIQALVCHGPSPSQLSSCPALLDLQTCRPTSWGRSRWRAKHPVSCSSD